MGERQRQRLPPAGGHPLIEPGELGPDHGVAGQRVDDVDEIGLAQEPQRPRVGVGAQRARAEQLPADLDDDRFAGRQRGNRLAVPNDVDDFVLEPDGDRLDLVQRPFVRLV